MSPVDSLRTETKFKKTEIGEIPVDWQIISLGEVSDEIYRYPTYYNIKYVEKGIPEVRGELMRANGTLENDPSLYRFISEETASKFPRTRLTEGDFVISVRGTMGKIAMIPKLLEGANITANLIRISPNRRIVHSPWLNQIFLSKKFQQELNNASSSTTIKTIKAPEIKSFKLAVPPIFEQRKIADILSGVDEAIERKQEVVEKTKELKKGLMQELLTRGIGHTKFKKTEIGEIPVDWQFVKLRRIMSLNYGKGLPDSKRKGSQYPVYGSNGIIGYHNDFLAKGPGVIVGRKGTVGSITWAESNYWPIDTTYYVASSSEKTHMQWLYFQLISMKLQTLNAATGVPGLNRDVALNLCIPLPPIQEQRKIAEILTSVDEDIQKEAEQKAYLGVLKKGLMDKLLTGKLRVFK